MVSRMTALQSGHVELSLLQSLQSAKCPHGKSTTAALAWKQFLHKLIFWRCSSSCFTLAYCEELRGEQAASDADCASARCWVSKPDGEVNRFVAWAVRRFSTKLPKLEKGALCCSNCLQIQNVCILGISTKTRILLVLCKNVRRRFVTSCTELDRAQHQDTQVAFFSLFTQPLAFVKIIIAQRTECCTWALRCVFPRHWSPLLSRLPPEKTFAILRLLFFPNFFSARVGRWSAAFCWKRKKLS